MNNSMASIAFRGDYLKAQLFSKDPRTIGRGVIHNKQLVDRQCMMLQRCQAVLHRGGVVEADHIGNNALIG